MYNPFANIFNFGSTKEAGIGNISVTGNDNGTSQVLQDEPTTASAIDFVSKTVAQMTIQVRDSSGGVVDNHPILKVINNPNPYTPSAYQLKYAIVQAMRIHGNAYLRITRNREGRPLEFYLMPFSEVTIESTPLGAPIYSHRITGTIRAKNILHFKDIPSSEVIGPSRVEQAKPLILNKVKSDRVVSRAFDRDLDVSTVITVPKSLKEDDRKTLTENVAAQSGLEGTGATNTLIVSEGITITPLAHTTPANEDFLAVQESLIHQLAASQGVPPSLLGITGGEKYNNASVRREAFYADTINPIRLTLEGVLTTLVADEGLHITLSDEALLQGNIRQQGQHLAGQVKGGIMTPNEAREALGIPKHEGDGADSLFTPDSLRDDETQETTGGNDGRFSNDSERSE